MSRTITVSEETYQGIKEQLQPDERMDVSCLEDMVGKAFFFRTVTYHLTGRVVRVMGNMLVLEDAAWIPDSGRFMDAIKNGNLNEVEPVGDAIINLGALIDAFPWNHPLPKDQV